MVHRRACLFQHGNGGSAIFPVNNRRARLRQRVADLSRLIAAERDAVRLGRYLVDLDDTRRALAWLDPLSAPLPDRLSRFASK